MESESTEKIVKIGTLTIDGINNTVYNNGQKLDLPRKEFELLKMLACMRGKVLTKDFLLEKIWGYKSFGETRTVDVHVGRLKRRIGPELCPIISIHGIGYKMAASN